MIIIEGPDGSGKSTLIKHLGYERRHLRALRGGVGADGERKEGWGGNLPVVTAYLNMIHQARVEEILNPPGSDSYGTLIAYDRFHLSEIVYGPVLRGSQEFSDSDLVRLNDCIRHLRVPVIMCLPPLEVTLENVFTPGRHVPHYQTREFLVNSYRRFQELTPWATVVYDFTRDEFSKMFPLKSGNGESRPVESASQVEGSQTRA